MEQQSPVISVENETTLRAPATTRDSYSYKWNINPLLYVWRGKPHSEHMQMEQQSPVMCVARETTLRTPANGATIPCYMCGEGNPTQSTCSDQGFLQCHKCFLIGHPHLEV